MSFLFAVEIEKNEEFMIHASLCSQSFCSKKGLVKVLCSNSTIASHGCKVHFVKFMRVYGSKLAYEAVTKAAGQSLVAMDW